MLSDMGITVVESEEAEEGAADKDTSAEDSAEEAEEGSRAMVAPSLPATTSARAEPTDRTDDPVRMYLRDMGSVELLSREGEIAIAKRIEAGREAMIAGLCESPLTFQAIIIWRDELNNAKILLRDIIDLEATYEGPEAKNAPPPMPVPHEAPAPVAAPAPRADGEGDGEPRAEGEMDDEDDFENAMSLAAMEAELKPKVLETFDNIAAAYKKLRKLQDKRVEMHVANEQINRSQQKTYDKSRDEIIKDVKSLSLNNARIEMLVEQLYKINKQPRALESRLMRLADSYGVPRQQFIDEYYGNELDQGWLDRMASSGSKKWNQFIKHEKEHVDEYPRGHSHAGVRDGPGDHRVPPHRQGRAEGRARSPPGQEGNGGGQPPPRDLDCQEVHQPRPAVPRPDPGRQHRPDEGGRQVRVPPRLQVLDLRHLVDPAGHHALDCRPGPDHPHPRAHDRDHQQDRAHQPPDAARDRPRADAGGAFRKARHAAGEGAQGAQDRQGADLLETPIGDEEDSHLGDFIEDRNAVLPIDAAIQSNLRETTTRVLASLTPREERVLRMRFGIGMNTDHTLEEVGQQFSVTRERIRQIEAKALRKLKHPSRSRKLRSFLDN